MIYPMVWRKTEEGREIIDGNTRAKLIAEGKVDLDEVASLSWTHRREYFFNL